MASNDDARGTIIILDLFQHRYSLWFLFSVELAYRLAIFFVIFFSTNKPKHTRHITRLMNLMLTLTKAKACTTRCSYALYIYIYRKVRTWFRNILHFSHGNPASKQITVVCELISTCKLINRNKYWWCASIFFEYTHVKKLLCRNFILNADSYFVKIILQWVVNIEIIIQVWNHNPSSRMFAVIVVFACNTGKCKIEISGVKQLRVS